MDERDYKALNATENKRTKYGFIIFGITCLILSICLHYCTPKPKQHPSALDSLTFVNKAIEVQLGYALAEAQKQADRAVKAELAAKQRDTIYLTRTRTIIASAPIDCQPFLTEMNLECDTLIMAHVYSGMVKDTLLMRKDTVINLYAEKDSISQLVIGEQKEDLKQAKKETRKERNGKRAAIGLGIGMTLLFLITNIIN